MVSFHTVYQRVVVHWRAIVLLLILAVASVPIAYGDYFDLITLALFLLFIASQVFWIGRIVDLGKWLFPDQPRVRLVVIADLEPDTGLIGEEAFAEINDASDPEHLAGNKEREQGEGDQIEIIAVRNGDR